MLLLTAKTKRCHPQATQNQRALARSPVRALFLFVAMSHIISHIIRFEILFVAAGSLLAVGVAYFY